MKSECLDFVRWAIDNGVHSQRRICFPLIRVSECP